MNLHSSPQNSTLYLIIAGESQFCWVVTRICNTIHTLFMQYPLAEKNLTCTLCSRNIIFAFSTRCFVYSRPLTLTPVISAVPAVSITLTFSPVSKSVTGSVEASNISSGLVTCGNENIFVICLLNFILNFLIHRRKVTSSHLPGNYPLLSRIHLCI